MKVIFLDFDGVLNSSDNQAAMGYEKKTENTEIIYGFTMDEYGVLFDERCVRWLSYIVGVTRSKFVISSTWRLMGLEKLKAMWKHRDLPGEVIGVTPWHLDTDKRGDQIKYWLQSNKVDSYCIIDDVNEMLDEQQEFFVKTDYEFGLTMDTSTKIVSILNKDSNNEN